MQVALVSLFWGSLAGLLYAYVGYPLLVWVAATVSEPLRRLCGGESPIDLRPVDEERPQVTVLIAAHNAEQHIVERIQNILDGDYPGDRLQILVASDGSTDRTVAAVQRIGLPNVSVVAYAARRGKIATLSQAVEQVTSEVIVFTDASNRFDRQSIGNLVRHFQDPSVGLVSGKACMVDDRGRPSESLYWRSEMMVRRGEAKLGIMLGASGAIYAVRRSMFVKPTRPVINDDLVVPMLVHLKNGCQVRFEQAARAYVTSSGGIQCEFRRRCRIGTGAFQCLPLLGDLMRPRHAKQAFAFASHKLLRWLCPFLLLSLLVSNLALASSEAYQAILWFQAAAYLTAIAGLIAPDRGFLGRVSRILSSFVFMNVALLVGFLRWWLSPGTVIWNPTRRPTWNQLEAAKNI